MEIELPIELLDDEQPFRVIRPHQGQWQAFPLIARHVYCWLHEHVEIAGYGLATLYDLDKPQVIVGASIHFERDEDAVHFKLRWL